MNKGLNTVPSYVEALEMSDFLIALAFPPHPSAAAPSDERGALNSLTSAERLEVNKYWGELKRSHKLARNLKSGCYVRS